MSVPPPSPVELEVVHVLFSDIVAYSTLSMEAQSSAIMCLQKLLRSTPEFQRADGRKELVSLPTGDGLVLVFSRDPVAPVRCALELAERLRATPEIKLRMGLHSGPAQSVSDINANRNFTGGGLNIAQRVMDCGDENHILLSNTVAEYLQQVGGWGEFLIDLGPCEVKHQTSIHLFNLCKGNLGNPRTPFRLRQTNRIQRAQLEVSKDGTIAILYKRNAQPDERLLEFIERSLKQNGYGVFIDRHLAIGVEWAREIEEQVRNAEAVVPLLSAGSVQSEMLAYEIETAFEAQQIRGKPRILPVRVAFQGPLPEGMARILDPLEYVLWKGPDDDGLVASELLRSLESSPAVKKPPSLESVGGAVPLSSQFYLERPTDEEFREAILRKDTIVLVKGPRQIGKTSLLARGLQDARKSGARVVLTDFQTFTNKHLQNVERFYLTIAQVLAKQLELEGDVEKIGNGRTDPSIAFETFLRRQILEKLDCPLVWGLDEVDRLFSCDFGSEVFGLIRSWHNARALDPQGPWECLTLAIAYATEAHLFITDINQSPFNVGTRLVLEDFTLEQVEELNRRYGSPLRGDSELIGFYELLGGNPYLVRRGLNESSSRGFGFDQFRREADRDEGPFGDHLRRILVLLSKEPRLVEITRALVQGNPGAALEDFYRLRSSGIVVGDSPRDMVFRCQLYDRYLRRHLA